MSKSDYGLAVAPADNRKKDRRRNPPRRVNAEPVGINDFKETAAPVPVKLLLIEADPFLSWEFKQLLDSVGFDVEVRSSAKEAAGEGMFAHFPVVMIGAQTQPVARTSLLRGLHQRADAAPSLVLTESNRCDVDGHRPMPPREHLVKTFQIEAVVTRLLELLRPKRIVRSLTLRFGNVSVDGDGQVYIGRKIAHFQPTEVALLSLLIRRAGKIVTRRAIEACLYGKAGQTTANAVEVYVHRLRKSLAAVPANVRIRTIRNAGYFIAHDDAAD
ncbi:MAG TPA: winged helix-turn-helix domain-containing protein [Stellaceae bacterium]|nr:winged helix-turn-helix domain-containing protein [Stellaceae bacterium]